MPKTLSECLMIGDELENQVAAKLRERGFIVFQKALVPYYPNCPNSTELDIIALRPDLLLTVECKNYHGAVCYSPASDKWTWRCGSRYGEMHDPYRQSRSHAKALRSWFNCDVIFAIVIPDETVYAGPMNKGVFHLFDLDTLLETIQPANNISPGLYNAMCARCNEWAHPSSEERSKHVKGVNLRRNVNDMTALRNKQSVLKYCVVLDHNDHTYFYYYTDEQQNYWFAETLDEATLLESLEEAREIAACICGADVCSMEYGYVDYVSEPDEFEGMTLQEYAEAIGARPW